MMKGAECVDSGFAGHDRRILLMEEIFKFRSEKEVFA